MAMFTVHRTTNGAPEEAVFVRDGFRFWAFVFGPLWLLARGFWLILLVYLAIVAGVAFALHALGLPQGVLSAFIILAHLLLGLEAAPLLADRLDRRGAATVAVVQGSRLDDAERRYFAATQQDRTASASEPTGFQPDVAGALI